MLIEPLYEIKQSWLPQHHYGLVIESSTQLISLKALIHLVMSILWVYNQTLHWINLELYKSDWR